MKMRSSPARWWRWPQVSTWCYSVYKLSQNVCMLRKILITKLTNGTCCMHMTVSHTVWMQKEQSDRTKKMPSNYTQKKTYPVSECNSEVGTQWFHPEQCPQEHHHHSSQQWEKHLPAGGTWQNKHGGRDDSFNLRRSTQWPLNRRLLVILSVVVAHAHWNKTISHWL